MSARLPLLFEIGVEEIPHWMIRPALGEMERIFRELCEANRIEPGAAAAGCDPAPTGAALATGCPNGSADREELRARAAEVGRRGRGARDLRGKTA